MTLFLNFRTAGTGGDVVSDPYVIEGDGLTDPVALRTLGWQLPADRTNGREIVFATHGFNVSYSEGVHALARLEAELQLAPRFVFVGVLWPGDYWLPVINYPAEADDAVRCGRRLAEFANTTLRRAGALSFVAHSLGARLMLEAVKHLERRAREVCLLAAAVDDDCLATRQYDDARANAERTSVLASTKDLVLRLAYPAGDLVSDILYDDDGWLRRALGYHGPRPHAPEAVTHAQIAETDGYGHGDYLPPSKLGATNPKTARPREFVYEALLDLPHAWP